MTVLYVTTFGLEAYNNRFVIDLFLSYTYDKTVIEISFINRL